MHEVTVIVEVVSVVIVLPLWTDVTGQIVSVVYVVHVAVSTLLLLGAVGLIHELEGLREEGWCHTLELGEVGWSQEPEGVDFPQDSEFEGVPDGFSQGAVELVTHPPAEARPMKPVRTAKDFMISFLHRYT